MVPYNEKFLKNVQFAPGKQPTKGKEMNPDEKKWFQDHPLPKGHKALTQRCWENVVQNHPFALLFAQERFDSMPKSMQDRIKKQCKV